MVYGAHCYYFFLYFFNFFIFSFRYLKKKKRRGQEVNIKMPNVLRKNKLMVLPCSAARPPGNVRKTISQLQGDSATCDAKKGHGVIMNIYYTPSTLKLSVSVLRLEEKNKSNNIGVGSKEFSSKFFPPP